MTVKDFFEIFVFSGAIAVTVCHQDYNIDMTRIYRNIDTLLEDIGNLVITSYSLDVFKDFPHLIIYATMNTDSD